MKRTFLSGILVGILAGMLLVLVWTQPLAGKAVQWFGTERVWDDGRLHPNETFTWAGGRDEDGFASGNGVLQWYVDGAPGNRYEGNLKRGRIDGQGSCTFANGNRYDGAWVDGRRHGKGTFCWANGTRYEGEFVRDQRTGKGNMTYANGDRYEGDWVDGWRTGKGTMVYANGDRYEGDWREDKRIGRGVLVLADGRRQEGKWSGSYAGPPQSPVNFLLLFAALAGAVLGVLRKSIIDGQLSSLRLAKYTGYYVLLAFFAALLVNFDVVGQFLFEWEYYGFGLNNTVVLYWLVGAGGAAAWRVAGKTCVTWRGLVAFLAVYGLFTVLLWLIWYAYAFFFMFSVFSLGWR